MKVLEPYLNKIIQGDSKELLKTLPDNSVDAIVTDPPYGLSFMGKKWDYDVPSEEIWRECLRVLKPGGYLLSFAGTRTQHRMAVRIEDAGFEIRDMIAWVYGSGFPKSLNIGKAVDKLQGNEREVIGEREVLDIRNGHGREYGSAMFAGEKTGKIMHKDTKGTSEWEGWGTALKPALEPITVARKPLEGTVADNVLKWGTGGINIDGCRVGTTGARNNGNSKGTIGSNSLGVYGKAVKQDYNMGRFPANLIHDGSDEVVGLFPNDNARFFYCAKASKAERNRGCEGFEEKEIALNTGENHNVATLGRETKYRNNHPTVKPIALMEYLIKLVSKEGHTILDPFAGSGSTLIAAKKLKREFIGIELDPEYIKIAEARLDSVEQPLF